MKIKLIMPSDKGSDIFLNYQHSSMIQVMGLPLALPTLAALTPEEHQVKIVDENIDEIDFDDPVDLVGISFFTYLAPRAYEIADQYRKKGVKVILGGIHASMLSEEASLHADCIVIGEAEEIWPRLLNDAKNGKLAKVYRQENFPDLHNAPIPRWDLVDVSRYSYFSVQVGRGCPHGCDFCSVYIYNGRQYRNKKIDKVIEEVRYLKSLDKRKSIFFVDDNILSDGEYAKKLFTALIPLKIKWWGQASIDRLQDEELLNLMFLSGCREVFIGLESISEKSLASIGKTKANRIEDYEKTIDKIHHHGIAIFGSFIFGADTDTKDVFDNTLDFIQRTNIHIAMINILLPIPGTNLYKRLDNEKRITNKDWASYTGAHVCIEPRLMSPEELLSGQRELLRKLYSYKNIYKRLKKLWRMGVLVREKENRKLLTKGRILITLKIILSSPLDIKRNWFIMKCFWNPCVSSIMSVLLALNFHDYSYKE